MILWRFLYRALLGPALAVGARSLAPFSSKIRRGLAGRRTQRLVMQPRIDPASFAIHIHASSVGEFEQAKPIIEALRLEHLSYRITASFYSPSGFEQQASYPSIDAAYYLPEDRPAHVRRFLDHVRPDLIIIIRYDIWPEFVQTAYERDIPCALVCATLSSDSGRLNVFARGFFTWLYSRLGLIDCVASEDMDSFMRMAPSVPLTVSGDTRYDRVVERAAAVAGAAGEVPLARAQLGNVPVVVAGSTWPADEKLLMALSGREDVRLVIVPHEPTPEHVSALRSAFPESVLLSELERGDQLKSTSTLIVDRTGILLALYSIADVAYVGGGFGAGVHSVLEPAAHGVPVVCGPRIERSRDASALHRAGLLDVVTTASSCVRVIEEFVRNDRLRRDRGQQTVAFVRLRTGASGRIIGELRRHRLLPAHTE